MLEETLKVAQQNVYRAQYRKPLSILCLQLYKRDRVIEKCVHM